MEEMQTKHSMRNLKRKEIKQKHEVLIQHQFEDMRKREQVTIERLSYSPSSNEHKVVTNSNSPKRVKAEGEDANTEELLRSIQEKMLNCSRRSSDLKTCYKQKIHEHIDKVNRTLSTTLAAEEIMHRTQLFKAAQKSRQVMKHRVTAMQNSKESKIHLIAEKMRSLNDVKLAKAIENRSELKKMEREKLEMVEERSFAKIRAATISLDAIQKEAIRRKMQRAQARKQEQLENYSKQVQILVTTRQEMKKNRVRDKERHSAAIISFMNQQKLQLMETKIRDQLELKRQREESKDNRIKSGKAKGAEHTIA